MAKSHELSTQQLQHSADAAVMRLSSAHTASFQFGMVHRLPHKVDL
jgi:hypothetical protein